VNQFYEITVDNLKEIRYNIYKSLLNKIIPCEDLIKLVQNTFTQPTAQNNYINTLPNIIESKFKRPLDKLQQKSNVPKSILRYIWDMMTLNIYECMIEAYSLGQSYNEGIRKQMLTDLERIQVVFKSLNPDFHNQYKDYVENYIKAFFIDAKQLENWINSNYQSNTYTYNQLYLLITHGPWDKKNKKSFYQLHKGIERSNFIVKSKFINKFMNESFFKLEFSVKNRISIFSNY